MYNGEKKNREEKKEEKTYAEEAIDRTWLWSEVRRKGKREEDKRGTGEQEGKREKRATRGKS